MVVSDLGAGASLRADVTPSRTDAWVPHGESGVQLVFVWGLLQDVIPPGRR